jgi:hypothetical protein
VLHQPGIADRVVIVGFCKNESIWQKSSKKHLWHFQIAISQVVAIGLLAQLDKVFGELGMVMPAFLQALKKFSTGSAPFRHQFLSWKADPFQEQKEVDDLD